MVLDGHERMTYVNLLTHFFQVHPGNLTWNLHITQIEKELPLPNDFHSWVQNVNFPVLLFGGKNGHFNQPPFGPDVTGHGISGFWWCFRSITANDCITGLGWYHQIRRGRPGAGEVEKKHIRVKSWKSMRMLKLVSKGWISDG